MWRFFILFYAFVGVTAVMAEGDLFARPGATLAVHTNPVIYKEPGVLVSGPRERHANADDTYTIGEEAADFPNAARRGNQHIVADEPNRARPENRTIAQSFPNQDRPDNRTLIEQRQEQAQDLAGNISSEEVLITVAGLTRGEEEEFAEILHESFGQIERIQPVSFDTGLAGFAVLLDADTKQFAERLEQRAFGGLGLDMVRFRPQQIDYVLKY